MQKTMPGAGRLAAGQMFRQRRLRPPWLGYLFEYTRSGEISTAVRRSAAMTRS
jgi:hypothetical protein